MRYVCLFSMAVTLCAQDGAALYKERCATCHDAPQGRVPALSAIKQMTGEAIYLALSNGSMKSQAEGLSTAQLIALIGYIAPTGGAAAKPAFEKTCTDASWKVTTSWSGWSPEVTNARFQN